MRAGTFGCVGSRAGYIGRGYTLAEMLVSIAAMAVLMVGISSAVLLATQALDDGESSAAKVREASLAVDRISHDLAWATAVSERTQTAVTFSVPDRDGDTLEETIRYAWSGTAGDPVTMQYNGGSVANLLETVRDFALGYDLGLKSGVSDPVQSESSESLLQERVVVADPQEFSVEMTNWVGQHFQPSLPADAILWKVTMVKFQAKQSGSADGLTWVQLRLADATNTPGSTVLEQQAMDESELTTTYEWKEYSFSNVSGVSPGQGLCLVLQHDGSGGSSATIRYDNGGGAGLVSTSSGGASWSYGSGKSLRFYAFGTITTMGSPEVVDLYHLEEVNVTLRTGEDAETRVDTAVSVLNEPEVSVP